jgi:hypothetical protein
LQTPETAYFTKVTRILDFCLITMSAMNGNFLTSHGRVVVWIASDLGRGMHDIGAALDTTERGATGRHRADSKLGCVITDKHGA